MNCMRMFDPKKISQLAIVYAIVNHEIGALAFFQASDFITATE